MRPNPLELGWALAGNIVVGIGAGTATVAAFLQNFRWSMGAIPWFG